MASSKISFDIGSIIFLRVALLGIGSFLILFNFGTVADKAAVRVEERRRDEVDATGLSTGRLDPVHGRVME